MTVADSSVFYSDHCLCESSVHQILQAIPASRNIMGENNLRFIKDESCRNIQLLKPGFFSVLEIFLLNSPSISFLQKCICVINVIVNYFAFLFFSTNNQYKLTATILPQCKNKAKNVCDDYQMLD